MKIFKLNLLLILINVNCNFSKDQTTKDGSLTTVNLNTSQAKDIISSDSNLIILDVRTPEEYADGKIANAINIDVEDESFKSKVTQLDKSKSYLVYCKAGSRSANAVSIMHELGFTKIYNLTNGYDDWIEN
jgi:rhodanese-related sulfurtransferase